MGRIRKAVDYYISIGWVVVPVVKGKKYPAVNWKEYQNRRPTQEEYDKWFENEDVGVGLITGKISGVIVIDEDSYKEQGKVLDLETPVKVITGSGGKHYYFRYQDGITNTVNRDVAVDVRGEGGFVVLPPTVHPNGNEYKWDIPQGTSVLEALKSLPALDESVAQQFIKSKDQAQKLDLTQYLNVSEGGRNDSLHRVTCSLLNSNSEEQTWETIKQINNTYSPPLTDRELEMLFRSAVNFVRANPKTLLSKNSLPPATEEVATPLKIYTVEEATSLFEEYQTKYGSGISTGFPLLDRYFKFLPEQLYLISASTHIGKTTICLNLAAKVAEQNKTVVFASLEQGFFVIPRLQTIMDTKQLPGSLYFIAPKGMPTVEEFIKTFEESEIKPDLLCIDHLHYFKRGGRGATEEVDKLIAEVQMLAKKIEVPIVVVTHLRKLNDAKGPTMDDLKDSSSLSQIPAVVCLIHREVNGEMEAASGGGTFKKEGRFVIAKNRIQGKTGSEKFVMLDSGKIVFNDEIVDYRDQPAPY